MVDQTMFRKYDIRGIALGDDAPLTADVMYLIGRAAGTYLVRRGHSHMIVGRDGRVTSEEYQQRFIEGLLSTGMNVTNTGLAVSPMVYFGSCQEEFDCGATITASHNPMEYSGVKLVGQNAHSICGDELQEMYQMICDEDFVTGEGQYAEKSLWPEYKKVLLNKVEITRPLKVVVDTANGVAGAFVRDLFANLDNIEAEFLYEEVDGTFPNHEANPEKESNMLDARAAALQIGADLAFGFDGDGDRVGLLDEQGTFYSADLLLMQLSRDLLTRHPEAKVVFDIKTSKVVENDIAARGGIPLRSATGHSLIEQKMKETGALLAGEISGHMFFAENYYGFDDAFLAMLKLIEIAAKQTKPFSALFAGVPQVVNTPEIKMPCADDVKFAIVDAVVNRFKREGHRCLDIDGAFVSLDENTWGVVRCSNTSPNLTLRFEALNKERMNEVKSLFKTMLSEYKELNTDLLG